MSRASLSAAMWGEAVFASLLAAIIVLTVVIRWVVVADNIMLPGVLR